MCVCVRACVRACVRECVRACVRTSVCSQRGSIRTSSGIVNARVLHVHDDVRTDIGLSVN